MWRLISLEEVGNWDHWRDTYAATNGIIGQLHVIILIALRNQKQMLLQESEKG